jgi:UDP-glucoronosyl and UDP-glucosyl transferase
MVTTATTTTTQTKKILVVTYAMTSHVYATAKMARLLDSSEIDGGISYNVEYALPDHTPSIKLAQALLPANIPIRRVGTVSTKKQMNIRTVTDPLSWTTLWKALRHPFPLAAGVNTLFDEQEGMYEPLKELIRTVNYDCVVGIHSACVTVIDALESLQQAYDDDIGDGEGRTVPPFITLSSLPYDPATQTSEWTAWNETRNLTTFPHVCIYPSTRPTKIISWASMRFWQALDTFLTWRAWKMNTSRANERRARRGLPPVSSPWCSYLRKYPAICFGGVKPFGEYKLPSNVTCIGSLDVPEIPIKASSGTGGGSGINAELQGWLNSAGESGVIYAGFGTGTTLSDQEATAFTGCLLRSIEEWPSAQPRILFALRSSEIERLEPIISQYLGTTPTFRTKNRIDYGPSLRIESDLPQASLLKEEQIGLFISHMGMGGFVEGVAGGVPFLCYPSGLDQYYNTQRAIEAGIGERIVHIDQLPEQVHRVWKHPSFVSASKQAQKALVDARGNERALEAIERLINHDTTSDDENTSDDEKQKNNLPTKEIEIATKETFDQVIDRENFAAASNTSANRMVASRAA